MRVIYKDIKPGVKFHRGKSESGYPREGLSWQVFVRYSGTQCQCIEQINYGNLRGVGKVYSINWQERVFLVEEITGL